MPNLRELDSPIRNQKRPDKSYTLDQVEELDLLWLRMFRNNGEFHKPTKHERITLAKIKNAAKNLANAMEIAVCGSPMKMWEQFASLSKPYTYLTCKFARKHNDDDENDEIDFMCSYANLYFYNYLIIELQLYIDECRR